MEEQNPAISSMMSKLGVIRDKYGDVAFKSAAEEAARFLIRQHPDLATAAREVLKDVVNFDTLDKEPSPSQDTSGHVAKDFMAHEIRKQVPGIRSQAQFDVFMASFDSLRLYLNHTFLGETEKAAEAKQILLEALSAAVTATELTNKLEEVPEAATSPEAEKFKTSPKELFEQHVKYGLLSELVEITSSSALEAWYVTNRPRIAQIVSQTYRNELLDAIRAKKLSFQPETV